MMTILCALLWVRGEKSVRHEPYLLKKGRGLVPILLALR